MTARAERRKRAWDRWLKEWGRVGFNLAAEMTARELRAGRNW